MPPVANNFKKSLANYKQWRDDLIAIIYSYQNWMEQQNLSDPEERAQIHELIDSLKSDKLVIALVGEFSRGKTELINAIFFADYKQRLLPSSAGRTTMCPTELLYEENQNPYIKLLPIETRKTTLTIAEYKQTPVHWTTIHIHNLNSNDEISGAFKEIVKTKKVSLREAHELGLYHSNSAAPVPNSELIEVPMWRHAIINFPHPLLKQGLVILDTPGLNALGAEPELTMSMLPAAHAILFALGADTGVTKTDLEVWNKHVCVATSGNGNARIAVLNKIDALWDELKDEKTVIANIVQQVDEVARILGIPKKFIFPVSAQKGLIGKIKADPVLLDKSGLLSLEIKLAEDILPAKQELTREKIAHEIGGRIAATATVLASRLKGINNQLAELKALGGKNIDEIHNTVAQLRIEKHKYDNETIGFQNTRNMLAEQGRILLNHLSISEFDKLVAKTRQDMQDSWTTHGLKVGMTSLFTGIVTAMGLANQQAQQIKGAIEISYEKFHSEYGLAKLFPADFSLAPYHAQLNKLTAEAETFRKNPVTTMMEQHFLIQKFFITLVSHAREVFNDCNAGARSWFKAIMSPVFTQIQDHKITMEQRTENLCKIQENLDVLGTQVSELENYKKNLEGQQKTINTMLARIREPLSYN